jgi:hypothetical protein
MNSGVAIQCNSDQTSVISWDERLHRALDRYNHIKGATPALIPALVEGLTEWAELLPYSFQDESGCHLPVNTWGLGAENTEIYALVDWLTLKGQHDLANALQKKFEALYRTTKALDENFPKISTQDHITEKRLVRICQRQVVQLISFLEELLKTAFKYVHKGPRKTKPVVAPNASTTHRKRSQRAADIEVLEKALIEHVKSSQDYAWAAIDAKKGPMLLPRPSKKDLAKQTGIKPWSLSRCFNDPHAHQLRLLWDVAGDLEQILRFKKK